MKPIVDILQYLEYCKKVSKLFIISSDSFPQIFSGSS